MFLSVYLVFFFLANKKHFEVLFPQMLFQVSGFCTYLEIDMITIVLNISAKIIVL